MELSFIDASSDLHNLDWSQHILSSRYDEDLNAIVAGTRFSPTAQFFASDRPPLGYDSDREAFVGPYRGLEDPVAVVAGRSGGSEAPRGNNIGSFCHEVVLEPGAEDRIVYVLGITDTPGDISTVIRRYRDPAEVELSFEAWVPTGRPTSRLSACRHRTWTPPPCSTAGARCSAARPCTGRVSCPGTRPDLDGGSAPTTRLRTRWEWFTPPPVEVASRMERLWGMQFADGHTWHQFFPFTGKGGPGLAAERPTWPQWFCDDHLWLVIATCAYLKETGDYAYLQRRVAYARGEAVGSPSAVSGSDEPGHARSDDTIRGHMLAALDFTLANRGPHGLPRSGFADWDDTLNVDHGSGLAESVWCAMQFCRAMLDLSELAGHLERPEEVARFQALHHEMAHAVNACAWDGTWYGRSFDDDGRLVGVSSEARHRINLIPQSWCVIGEVAPPERAELAMASAHEFLGTPYGPALMWPPYDGGDPRVNGTSTFPPGAKENGGIFCHAAAWSVVAAAKMGDGDRAYEYYRLLLPLSRPDVERSAVEPYVYCQNICGPAHPQYGLGRNAWLTGAAAWMYVAVTQWILGIRPTHAGLRIAPAIPSAWPGFSARRFFRGTWYNITVTRRGPG